MTNTYYYGYHSHMLFYCRSFAITVGARLYIPCTMCIYVYDDVDIIIIRVIFVWGTHASLSPFLSSVSYNNGNQQRAMSEEWISTLQTTPSSSSMHTNKSVCVSAMIIYFLLMLKAKRTARF